jgi:hypothetical protein
MIDCACPCWKLSATIEIDRALGRRERDRVQARQLAGYAGEFCVPGAAVSALLQTLACGLR